MLQSFFGFWGRFFISIIFIVSGVHKVLDWEGTEQFIVQALNNGLGYSFGLPPLQKIFQDLLPLTDIILIGGTFCELLGGVCVLLGIQVRFGAFLLIIFLLPMTLVAHPFWFLQEPERALQMGEFLKNLAILGGLFVLLAYGSGKRSPKVKANDKPADK